ncbi:hypothetical protein FPSE_06893 [Fusarium pseudograminearum CS3096]|uniref:RanBP2-type domain-containing protein n=1 Tax=Fusarium pseudograminearum (strain CS3096) TaxID=1028729 RepID=K3VFD1_FUSPC|nr:hypothetical protein FPSE_06893 [Fusarium pseudograminearum CS3096]EKJ72847.1 hypothetical protein FPSE_06893 [Fusarium pseudograminearum CS3096]
MAPITGIIDIHKNWRCDCGTINSIAEKYCTNCKEPRKKGSHALTHNNLKIGTLGTVFTDGREHWLYDKYSVDAYNLVVAEGC